MQPQQNLDLSLIVAMTPDRVIGRDDTLPWRLPSDMRRFKDITNGHPVIMGRKTWESIPLKFRPLPGRINIVVTRQKDYQAKGAVSFSSLEIALAVASSLRCNEVFCIGGAEIYRQLFPFAKKVYMTIVHATIDGNAFFPELDSTWKREDALKPWRWLNDDEFETSFLMYERISS